ncbi:MULTISPECIES: prepilin-type N-terminal cleavage/methylation domain-containing protein [Clostridium]|uniref:prepilin-type N-terminal cleavage/methylation domain-containing protein n=1 Tax=Clostridium TaxID=1485 RepID=UPI0018989C17|nr:prepilin-type N-terminal cleavage/methylation domain-containing protein [Clostridium sp.]MDU1822482.1 prepilin-type N-terminal cleavage/methylation domain-containing protein [Clostridium sp.]MDU1841648.1 prepilin-type N-terminal cleavage/methylation domain-containing protein [Clostridium sp.]MDU3259293.1 prepilin-type N-terminal cleavage/methylation domain-containing protein [Clostridium sp.]MDU4552149.1 prepilin-type N-terminal cleavage/methylation domain-containing protein [Clostridium sp.
MRAKGNGKLVNTNSNKGFTLLETTICLSISLIIISIAVSTAIEAYNYTRNLIIKSREINQVYNAFSTIDYFSSKEDVFKVDKSEDTVEIYENIGIENYKIKRVLKRGNNLSIVHYNETNVQEVSNNPIIESIEDFKVYKKGNLVYAEITKGGERYVKCI